MNKIILIYKVIKKTYTASDEEEDEGSGNPTHLTHHPPHPHQEQHSNPSVQPFNDLSAIGLVVVVGGLEGVVGRLKGVVEGLERVVGGLKGVVGWLKGVVGGLEGL